MIPEHIVHRKGPRSLKDIDPEVITFLNAGKIETKNLMEWLAVDQLELLRGVLADIDKLDWFSAFEAAVNAQKKPTANSNTRVIGETFAQLAKRSTLRAHLADHTSDVVRCWGCWAESILCDTVEELIDGMRPYAADQHFGVREVVIFATKERMAKELDITIPMMVEWTASNDENIRRFSVEALRPIGVWTKKIEVFQEEPEKGLPLLEPLKSDPSKYVRDAVGNWLNDASKSAPEWVQAVCDRWAKDSTSKETAYILKKALRSIKKK